MKVYIRNMERIELSPCGEMNPEQLDNFVHNLVEHGIYDGEELHSVDIHLQYVNSSIDLLPSFFVEIIWDAIDG